MKAYEFWQPAAMMIYLLMAGTVGLSLYVWGVVRTALWVVPAIITKDYLPLASASLLSFFTVATWIFPYRKEAFDGRDLNKEKLALLFFLTGVATGALVLSPAQLWIFIGGAAFPWILLQVFRIFRLRAGRILYLPKYLRLITLGLWCLVWASRWLEDLSHF